MSRLTIVLVFFCQWADLGEEEWSPFLLIHSPLKVWLSVKGFSSDNPIIVFVTVYALSSGFSYQGYLTRHVFKNKTMCSFNILMFQGKKRRKACGRI